MRAGPGPGGALGGRRGTLTAGGGDFVPALGHRGLTPFYDVLQRLFLRESRWKDALVRETGIQGGDSVLDVGCGTGTLALSLGEAAPGAEITGLDRDPAMIRRAARKSRNAGRRLRLTLGSATALPYPDDCFDLAVSSLLFHHLRPLEKVRAVEEIRRVLRPGGSVLLADWGRPGSPSMRVAYFLFVQLLDGFETTSGHVRGAVPRLLRAKGMEGVEAADRLDTLAGTLRIWRAREPGT